MGKASDPKSVRAIEKFVAGFTSDIPMAISRFPVKKTQGDPESFDYEYYFEDEGQNIVGRMNDQGGDHKTQFTHVDRTIECEWPPKMHVSEIQVMEFDELYEDMKEAMSNIVIGDIPKISNLTSEHIAALTLSKYPNMQFGDLYHPNGLTRYCSMFSSGHERFIPSLKTQYLLGKHIPAAAVIYPEKTYATISAAEFEGGRVNSLMKMSPIEIFKHLQSSPISPDDFELVLL